GQPAQVHLGQQDLRVEYATPFDDRAVEMRMAGADRVEPPELPDRVDRGIVEEAGRVPQQVSLTGLEQQTPLADPQHLVRSYADQAGRDLADLAVVPVGLEFCQRGPLLAGRRNPLALIRADRACLGW